MAHWPLWQSNGTKNTSFQESSPESSPVQNPGPVQGIVLPVISLHNGIHLDYAKGCGLARLYTTCKGLETVGLTLPIRVLIFSSIFS